MNILSSTTAQGRIGHCRTTDGGSLLDCLAAFGLSREEGERLLSFGAVYHERERVRSNRMLSPGDYVRVHLNPRRFPVDSVDWGATIVHQNDQFVIVNKPAGIPVHATVDNAMENVLCQLSRTLGFALHITQRLDIEVGGLLVLAKAREFQRQFNQLLVERRVKKRYRALVERAPEVGRHIHYMKPANRSPRMVRQEGRPDWQECVLRVDRVMQVGATSDQLLFQIDIDLETGRTHQIRAQLSAMGSPIVGDELYGSLRKYEIEGAQCRGIALSSVATSWNGEDGRGWSFELPVRLGWI